MVFRSRMVRLWDVEWVTWMGGTVMVNRAQRRRLSEFGVVR